MAFTCCIVDTVIENSFETEVLVENGWESGGCTKSDTRAVFQRNNSIGACSTDLESTVDGGECHQKASTETHSVESERIRVLVSIHP